MTGAPQQPVDVTPNPFTDKPSAFKRSFDSVESETYKRGTVQRPSKRNYRSTWPSIHIFSQYLMAPSLGGEQGQPPPGYRCKRCDSTDVRLDRYPLDCFRLNLC